MMNQAREKHVVRRLAVEVAGHDQLAIQKKQRMIMADREAHLYQVLERVFDKICPSGLTVDLDKLEIDVGSIDPADEVIEFEKQLEERAEAVLTESVIDAQIHHSLQNANEAQAIGFSGSRVRQRAEQELDLLGSYLRYGVLPWWSSDISPRDLLSRAISEDPRGIVQMLRTLLRGDDAISRLVRIASLSNIATLISAVSPHLDSALSSLCQMCDLNEKNHVKDPVIEFCKREVVGAMIENKSETSFLKAILESIPPALQTEQISKLKRAVKVLQSENRTGHISPEESDETSLGAYEVSTELSAIAAAESKRDIGTAEWEELVEEGIYIDNAGLVLLAPFLPRLFEECGLVSNAKDGLVSIEHAVLVLRFITHGEGEYDEHQFALAKILCGGEIESPLAESEGLKQSETAAINEMLESIIKHWNALGATSVNGLREGFLKRDGALIKKEDDWLVKVERETKDILIERLPWTYGIIKLPWMPQQLHVEW